MKLYVAPRSRSIRPRWLLEELGVPYEPVRVDLSSPAVTTPEYRALHPFGEVPVLVDGELTLFDSAAICLYLADRFPEKHLAPPLDSAARGPYLQWLLFAEMTLEPVVLEFFRNAQLPEEKKADLSKQRARLDEVLAVIEARLVGRENVAGESFSAADLVMASILHLANTLRLLEGRQQLVDYVMRHASRPAARRAVSG